MNKREIQEQMLRIVKSSAGIEDVTVMINGMLREMSPAYIEDAYQMVHCLAIGMGNTAPKIDEMLTAFEPWRDLYGLSERADSFYLAKPN